MSNLARCLWLLPFLAGVAHAGDVQRDQRRVDQFDRIVLRVPGETRIEQGPHASLAIEAEKVVLPAIVTTVRGGVLYIDARSFSTRERVCFHITVPYLSSVTSEGGGEVVLGRFDVPRLELTLSGSGALTASSLTAKELIATLDGAGSMYLENGALDTQRVLLSGAGEYVAKVPSRRASVTLEGAGSAFLEVRENLEAAIDGSGTVRYRGSPAVTRRITGAGKIEPEHRALLGGLM